MPPPREGLRWLAEQEQADIVVFGSDYRTAAGHVAPQKSAQALLEGGPAAVAIAPANYRSRPHLAVRPVGVLAEAGDDAAIETARELAESLGATRHPRRAATSTCWSSARAPRRPRAA